MPTVNSHRKGANGEREFAKQLRGYGYQAKRGPGQYVPGAAQDYADVHAPEMSDIHWEVKRQERAEYTRWYKQAQHDAKPGEEPIVGHRYSRRPWMVYMSLDSFMKFYDKAQSYDKLLKEQEEN